MRFFVGLAIILSGLILLLNNLGITNISLGEVISTYWPVIFLVWGAHLLFTPFKSGNTGEVQERGLSGELLSGIILAGLGVVLLVRNLGWLEVDLAFLWKLFWPALIILAGISLLQGKRTEGKHHLAFMAGLDLGKSSSWKLNSGSYLAFMGGIDLNLARAEIPQGETVLGLTAVMGGITIRIPENLPVICDGLALLGGIDFLGEGTGGIIANKHLSYQPDSETKTYLRIQARAFLGGIEVKKG